MTISDAALPPLLPDDVADFIQSGISITVAGRDERLVPSVAKAVSCRVSSDRRQVTVLLLAEPAAAVARDVACNGQVAVVFSKPSTHRTVQLKGHDATPVPLLPADAALARRHLALFAADLQLLGWRPGYAEALLAHDPAQLIAIRFTPGSAFLQTPGPGAGAAINLPQAGALK